MRLEKSLKFRAAVLKFWDKGGMDGLIFNYLGLTLFPISGSGGIGRNDIGIHEFLFDKDSVFGNIQQ